ncbi:MAG: VanZ family protein [Phycisphaerae bacterium]|nr:VanZ family protein [Phycisphaerae bacterium]
MNLRRDRMHGAFWLYVLLVYFLTHAPGVKVEGPIPRPDLVVHVTVFGLWTMLCIACGFFGAVWSTRNILVSGLVALAYSAFDEGLQAIPALQRVCAFDDWLANASGVVLVTGGALVLARVARR